MNLTERQECACFHLAIPLPGDVNSLTYLLTLGLAGRFSGGSPLPLSLSLAQRDSPVSDPLKGAIKPVQPLP